MVYTPIEKLKGLYQLRAYACNVGRIGLPKHIDH